MNLGTELPMVDEPAFILDGIVAERKKLLEGFKGRKHRPLRCQTADATRPALPAREKREDVGIDLEKLERAMEPSLYTMSLSGEATLYPRLGEMFAEIRRRGAVSFLVTNGLNPSVLAGFKDDELPTQMTISMNAPNEDLFFSFNRCSLKDGWERFSESLDVMRKLKGKVRRAIRLTLVKDENDLDENVSEYVDLIKRAEPDFVHIKGFKSIGYARGRLGYDKQVWLDGVKDYAIKICEGLNRGKVHALRGKVHASHGKVQSLCDWKSSLRGGLADEDLSCEYEVVGEDERCCVVVLGRVGVGLRILRV